MNKKHYYKFLGWCDGSGKPYRLIIKYLTELEVKERIKNGYVYELIC